MIERSKVEDQELLEFRSKAGDPAEGAFSIQSRTPTLLPLVGFASTWSVFFFPNAPEFIKIWAAAALIFFGVSITFITTLRPTASMLKSVVRISSSFSSVCFYPHNIRVRGFARFPFRGLEFIDDSRERKSVRTTKFGSSTDLYPSGVWLLASLAAKGAKVDVLGFDDYSGPSPLGRLPLSGLFWERLAPAFVLGILIPLVGYILLLASGQAGQWAIAFVLLVALVGLILGLICAAMVIEYSGHGLQSIEIQEDKVTVRRLWQEGLSVEFQNLRNIRIVLVQSNSLISSITLEAETFYGRKHLIKHRARALSTGSLSFVEAARRSGVSICYLLVRSKKADPEEILTLNPIELRGTGLSPTGRTKDATALMEEEV